MYQETIKRAGKNFIPQLRLFVVTRKAKRERERGGGQGIEERERCVERQSCCRRHGRPRRRLRRRKRANV